MQKLKSKLLPSSSFSGLSSVVWKRKETSERDWVLKRWLVGIISESRAELAPGWVDFGRDGSQIVREIDVLSCKMSNRCFALCFFFVWNFTSLGTEFTRPFVSLGWWIRRAATFSLYICSKKLFAPGYWWQWAEWRSELLWFLSLCIFIHS